MCIIELFSSVKESLRQYSGKVKQLNLSGITKGLEIQQSFFRYLARILCGNWLGKKGFYDAEIEDVKYYQSLSEIREVEGDQKRGDTIISKPIKGTSKSLKFLQNSEKDKADA